MDSTFCLDKIIDRRNTNSIKWDTIRGTIPGCSDEEAARVLPMWVADMDFQAPPAVLERMCSAVEHGIFGYASVPSEVWDAVSAWTTRRYRWTAEPQWMSYTPGVITGLNIAIQTFTRPGEKIIVQPPVYPPFHNSVICNGRRLVYNPLVQNDDGVFLQDPQQLRSLIDSDTSMLVLCNPHNPVGRAWTRAELEVLAGIALEHDLLIFSDEIHADLLLQQTPHVPFASLGPEVASRTITGIAPSKTFNIAGLKASVIITPNERLRSAFDAAQARTFGLYDANTFAIVAMHAAYTEGEEWLDVVLEYLRENRDTALTFLAGNLPHVHAPSPEATFLFWVNFADTGFSHEEVCRILQEGAQVILNDGRSFGPGGENCFRLNFGCPRATLTTGLERIAQAFARAGGRK